jgi:3-oxoacyl-[acyl-carrier-protein] synthase III
VALFAIQNLRLRAIAASVPVHEVSNQDLELIDGSNGSAFVEAVGIKTRRVAPSAICATDLCLAAARRTLEGLGVDAAEIGALVFVTQTPDYAVPGNSVLVQHELGLPASAYLLDVNQGCAGYVYGLASLAAIMRATGITKGMLLAGDTITRLLSPKDRSTVPIFSDAGSATLLEAVPEAETMYFNLGSQGQGADIIQVKGGGARQPFGPDSLLMREEDKNIKRAPIHLSMRGLDVLHYALRYVAPSIAELLAFANGAAGTPDHYVFHQANRIVNHSLMCRLGIPSEKAPETLLDYGNTSSATIPVTICHRLAGELARGSSTLLLCGFGSGFSWGSVLVKAGPVLCPELIEMSDGS